MHDGKVTYMEFFIVSASADAPPAWSGFCCCQQHAARNATLLQGLHGHWHVTPALPPEDARRRALAS